MALSGTFYNGIYVFFCPVLSTMELIFVRYFLQWNLFFPVLSTMEFIWYLFRYFLQWNLYGTRAVDANFETHGSRNDPRFQHFLVLVLSTRRYWSILIYNRSASSCRAFTTTTICNSGNIYTAILIYIDLSSICVGSSCFYNDNYLQFW